MVCAWFAQLGEKYGVFSLRFGRVVVITISRKYFRVSSQIFDGEGFYRSVYRGRNRCERKANATTIIISWILITYYA